jgi:hypothetical protein
LSMGSSDRPSSDVLGTFMNDVKGAWSKVNKWGFAAAALLVWGYVLQWNCELARPGTSFRIYLTTCYKLCIAFQLAVVVLPAGWLTLVCMLGDL